VMQAMVARAITYGTSFLQFVERSEDTLHFQRPLCLYVRFRLSRLQALHSELRPSLVYEFLANKSSTKMRSQPEQYFLPSALSFASSLFPNFLVTLAIPANFLLIIQHPKTLVANSLLSGLWIKIILTKLTRSHSLFL
jgi:hypothetical protein